MTIEAGDEVGPFERWAFRPVGMVIQEVPFRRLVGGILGVVTCKRMVIGLVSLPLNRCSSGIVSGGLPGGRPPRIFVGSGPFAGSQATVALGRAKSFPVTSFVVAGIIISIVSGVGPPGEGSGNPRASWRHAHIAELRGVEGGGAAAAHCEADVAGGSEGGVGAAVHQGPRGAVAALV